MKGKWHIVVLLGGLFFSCSGKQVLLDKRDKAIAYLAAAPFRFDHVYLYAYLKRQYALPDIAPLQRLDTIRDSLGRVNDRDAQRTLRLMHWYGRLADPTYTPEPDVFTQATGLDSLLLAALYCDKHAWDTAAYQRQLQTTLNQGEYNATHVLLCLVFLQEHQCRDGKLHRQALADARKTNYTMLKERNAWDDIRIESAAILLHTGQPLPQSWVREIINLQHTDGGWGLHPGQAQSDPHTTILALWVLCALIGR